MVVKIGIIFLDQILGTVTRLPIAYWKPFFFLKTVRPIEVGKGGIPQR
jgi:hypothetical protein